MKEDTKFLINTPLSQWLYIAIIFIAIFILLFSYHWLVVLNKQIDNLIPFISIFVALNVALIGGYVVVKNSIKQHTISYWIQVRNSDAYTKSWIIINEMGGNIKFNEDFLKSERFKNDYEHYLKHVLNEMEFISVCLRTGNFDEIILKNILRGNVLRLYTYAEIYIKDLRDKEKMNSIFEHFEALHERWKA